MRHLRTFRLIDAIARTGSIRAAAERMYQTPSAVQRRLQSYEEELGFPIFERTSKGVRLSVAGEIVIVHIRQTLAESDRLSSRLSDLAGLRSGHVTIGCSQALLPYFLPAQIARYRTDHPSVTFDVQMMEHSQAAAALDALLVDLVLVCDEAPGTEYEVHLAAPQRLSAIMARDHALTAHETPRLRDCYAYPVALASTGFSGRRLLDRALNGKTYRRAPTLQSNSFEFLKSFIRDTDAITFQVEIGAPDQDQVPGLVSRVVDPRDVTGGMVVLGLKRSRALPIAVSRFVEQVAMALSRRY